MAGATVAGTDQMKEPELPAATPCVTFSTSTPPFIRAIFTVEAVSVPVHCQDMTTGEPTNRTVPLEDG